MLRTFTHFDLHRKVYSAMLDALDKEIVQKIMQDPNCEESRLLNMRVDAEINRQIEAVKAETN